MHGYGEKCSDAKITIGIWNLPVVDINNNNVEIPFYVTEGDGVLLFGNNKLKNSTIDGGKNIITFPIGTFKHHDCSQRR